MYPVGSEMTMSASGAHGYELQDHSGQRGSRPRYASVLREYWSQPSGDNGSVRVGWSTVMLTVRQNNARHQLARNPAISPLPAAAVPRGALYERYKARTDNNR
jgi:hypothetical protein